MADIGNVMPEHPKRSGSTLDRIERTLDGHTSRLAKLEGGEAAIVGHLAAADAARQVAVDNIRTRLDRIERRLELVD